MRQPSTWCGKATISAPGEKLLLLAPCSPLSESFPSIDLCHGVWFHLSRSSACSVESEFKSMTVNHLINALEHAATMLCSEKKSQTNSNILSKLVTLNVCVKFPSSSSCVLYLEPMHSIAKALLVRADMQCISACLAKS